MDNPIDWDDIAANADHSPGATLANWQGVLDRGDLQDVIVVGILEGGHIAFSTSMLGGMRLVGVLESVKSMAIQRMQQGPPRDMP